MCYLYLKRGILIKTGVSEVFGKSFRSEKCIAQCSHPECRMFAHNLSIDNDRKIFNLPENKGKYKTCFDILHSNECKGLFSVIHGNIAHNDNLFAGARKKRGYEVNVSHPIYSALRNTYGLPLFGRRRRVGREKGAMINRKKQMMMVAVAVTLNKSYFMIHLIKCR